MEPTILKSAKADKLSGKGYLLYRIVYDSMFGICFEITANLINTECEGKFSRELIPFSCIESLLNAQRKTAIRSKLLNGIFEKK